MCKTQRLILGDDNQALKADGADVSCVPSKPDIAFLTPGRTPRVPDDPVFDTVLSTITNAADGVAVFSEIYYPDGWQTTIDGQPASLARADYVLRALHIPAGRHTIEMRFDPKSLHVTEAVANGAMVVLLLVLLFVLGRAVWQRRKMSGQGA